MTGQEVRRLRARLGLYQTELAAKLGVHTVTVCRWETGVVNISEPAARLLALLAQAAKTPRRRKRS